LGRGKGRDGHGPKSKRKETKMSTKSKQTAKQRPVETIRDGAIKAAIWRNDSENGVFHGVTFSRTYKNGEGELQDTNSYSGTQLLRLARLAGKAYDRAAKLTKEARSSDNADEVEDHDEIPF
jgi:hypothetical protein